jgi:uncharacterized membrane protein YeaQ/YmgE (transglycosylase-associated protein family)
VIPLVVMILMVGILAGAVAREVGIEPQPLGDIGPWLFGLAGSAVGGVVGLLLGGGDPARNSDQAWALVGWIVGAGIGAVAFVVLLAGGQRSIAGNTDTRQGATPVSGARNPETGAIDGP